MGGTGCNLGALKAAVNHLTTRRGVSLTPQSILSRSVSTFFSACAQNSHDSVVGARGLLEALELQGQTECLSNLFTELYRESMLISPPIREHLGRVERRLSGLERLLSTGKTTADDDPKLVVSQNLEDLFFVAARNWKDFDYGDNVVFFAKLQAVFSLALSENARGLIADEGVELSEVDLSVLRAILNQVVDCFDASRP